MKDTFAATAKHVLVALVMAALFLPPLAGCSVITGEENNTILAAGPGVYRSDTHHLTVLMPAGWGTTEEPDLGPFHVECWVAFNSWGEDGFFAIANRGYTPEIVMAQLPPGGAYMAVVESTIFSYPNDTLPEYASRDLSDLYTPHDWRTDSLDPNDSIVFAKWAHNLVVQVVCRPDASDATVAQINELLAGFRFDAVPEGDPFWMGLRARQALSEKIDVHYFSPEPGVIGARDGTYTTQARLYGNGLLFRFIRRASGGARWWEVTVTPFGQAAIIASGRE